MRCGNAHLLRELLYAKETTGQPWEQAMADFLLNANKLCAAARERQIVFSADTCWRRPVRYTQPGAVMKEDSMDRWRSELKLQTNAVELQSWDYRTLDSRPVSAMGTQNDGPTLTSRNVPGAYAYPTRSQGNAWPTTTCNRWRLVVKSSSVPGRYENLHRRRPLRCKAKLCTTGRTATMRGRS